VAFDLEANGFFRYPEQVCLMQVGIPDQSYIIDPLSIKDMTPLGDVLADESIQKIVHACDYDVRSLDRDWDFRLHNLFGTHIAAAFVGQTRLGLGAVLEDVVKVVIPKEKAIQRQDWGRRPLDDESLEYAVSDVAYLHELREALATRLSDLGRSEWVAEECARMSNIRHARPDPEAAVFKVKGGRDLDGRGLAILRRLIVYRELKALTADRPPFKVMPDSALVAIAAEPASDLRKIPGLGRFIRRPLVDELRAAIKEGQQAEPIQRPKQPRIPRISNVERNLRRERLKGLKAWRIEHGASLELDPALLWPLVSLERITREPDAVEAEMEAPEVRAWQAREFGDSLREKVASLRATEPAD